MEIQIRQQIVELGERLFTEVSEFKQIVPVETHQISHGFHFGGLQAVERTHRKILIGKFGLQQLTHVKHIFVKFLRSTVFLEVQCNFFI